MSFDLEKAEAVCKTLPKYMNGACPCKEEAEAAKMLIKALPEIRRLQEFRDRVARILKQPLTDCDDLLILGLDARLCQLRRQAAEIERPQGFETAARDLNNDLIRIAGERDELAARIQELADALAEYQRLGKIMEGRLPCLTLHGECERCSSRAKEVCDAMHQIAEGKIGPEDAKPHKHTTEMTELNADHQYPPDTPRSWQITEERKEALDRVLNYMDYMYPKSSPYYHCALDVSVLRAMLEAGQ